MVSPGPGSQHGEDQRPGPGRREQPHRHALGVGDEGRLGRFAFLLAAALGDLLHLLHLVQRPRQLVSPRRLDLVAATWAQIAV